MAQTDSDWQQVQTAPPISDWQPVKPATSALVPPIPKSPGSLETFGEHTATGIAPGAAFALAAPSGAKYGAALGAMIPGADVTGIPEAVGAFLGGLITGGVASWGAYKAQHATLKAAAPKFTDEMDKRLQAGADAHPFAAVAGDVAGNIPSMELSLPKLAQLPMRAALGGTIGGVLPLAQGRKPTLEDVAGGAASAALLGEPRFGKVKPSTTGDSDAIRQQKTGTVLQRQQGQIGETGGGRGGVEQVQQGKTPANAPPQENAEIQKAAQNENARQPVAQPVPPLKAGTADAVLSRGQGKTSPSEIAAMPEDEYQKLNRSKTDDGSQAFLLTADATQWAMENPDASIPDLEKLRAQHVADQEASGYKLLDRSQWFSDAIHALKGDEVGKKNIDTINREASKVPDKIASQVGGLKFKASGLGRWTFDLTDEGAAKGQTITVKQGATPSEIAAKKQAAIDSYKEPEPTLESSEPIDPRTAGKIEPPQPARPVRQSQLQPLGADLAAQPRQGSPTAMKYRLIDQERRKRGLEPLAKPAGVSDQAVMDKAMAEIDRNPSLPDKLVSELNTKPRSIDAWERMVLLLHKIDLRHEFEKSANEAAQAFDDSKEYPDRKADMVAANLRTADLSDQLTKLENASRVSGSEQGRGLRSLRIMANEDYSLASLETQRRAAKGGEPLTDSERADLKKIADDYKKANDELTAHLAAARLRISTLESGKALTEIQKTPRLPKGADIGAQKTRLQGIIGNKIKAGKLDEITNPIQQLARLFVQSGISDRDELIDAVHGVLRDIDPKITRRDTMDAISGYGDFKQLSKDEISVKLRGMKGEMQQIGKLEDMVKGVPPSKTGVERRTPTDAERKLIKAVNEAKIKFQVPITDSATQLKSALDTRKIQLQRQIEAMQEKMASGDFEKAPRRELVLDLRAQELQAEKERVAKKFKRQQDDYQKAAAKNSSKFLDFISNLRRFAVLSGVNVVGKLAAYSATKLPTIGTTEAIGGALGKVPKVSTVLSKAPSEGGFSARAISNAVAKGLTQGFVDAYQTATKGQSDLRAAYSNRIESGREWYNFFQTIHEVVKSPLRRTAFELSLAKRMDFAQRHGADITDPLTQLALSKDAYLDSDRALLLENNRLAGGIRGLFKQLEAKDKNTGTVPLHGKIAATAGRVELPILNVPLNYVKQTLTSAFGLVSGSVKLRAAFKAGIENLKPEEADAIARHLKYGTIGGAAALWGFIDGYKNGANGTFGGFYQPGQKRKDDQAGVGGIRIDGHNIPGLFLHNPVIAVAQMTHMIGAIMATKLNKKTDQTHSLPVAAAAGLMGLLNQSPLGNVVEGASQLSDPRSAEWAMGEHVKGLVDPQLSQEIAQWTDKNAQGNVINRDPKTITQHVETGIPILRKNVPEKIPTRHTFTLDLSPLNR
jgi:hypothetical protein